ncbi:MAG: hypothetical protein ACP5VF_09415 [Acidobacteriota bacterium]
MRKKVCELDAEPGDLEGPGIKDEQFHGIPDLSSRVVREQPREGAKHLLPVLVLERLAGLLLVTPPCKQHQAAQGGAAPIHALQAVQPEFLYIPSRDPVEGLTLEVR